MRAQRVLDANLLAEQSRRIDAALATIPPSDNEPSMYFLGFAGVGEQKVFAGEVNLARQRIADRYALGARHIELVNDERDRTSRPIASVANLRRALNGIGARMHRDRDVLFLAVSSHGSADPEIEVANGSLSLRQLGPKDLRDSLRQAGIEWRVIVISACFAGAFIPYLQDARTIVIAAAAPHRTSFGCTNDRDLTYFGEAFYRDALPRAASLREAFDTAKKAIALRERRERISASKPSAHFGAALEKKLRQFERRPRNTGSAQRDRWDMTRATSYPMPRNEPAPAAVRKFLQ